MLAQKKHTKRKADRGKGRCVFFSHFSFVDERRLEHHNKTSITKSALFKSNTAKVVMIADTHRETANERDKITFFVCQHQNRPTQREREKKSTKNAQNEMNTWNNQRKKSDL